MYDSRRRVIVRSLALAVVLLLGLGGCSILNLLGGVPFNKIIEGEIDFRNDHSSDSNDLIFYWDWYQIRLDRSKTYSLELWTDPDVPIHFECDELGEDLGAWDDGDGTWDGYLLYEFPSDLSKVGFDFYLRADYVSEPSWYEFRINEE